MDACGTVIENYRKVEAQITEACLRSGRERSTVTLVAVSKTKPEEEIRALIEAGQLHFGENKVQDLCQKMTDITGDSLHKPIWHMIGTLQTNKVKYLTGSPVYLIHSLDSVKLAAAIEKEALKKCPDRQVSVLMEINIGGEITKGGFAPEEAENALREIAAFPHVLVRGLMTVCPPGSAEDNRKYFRKMRMLRDDLRRLEIPNTDITELSMGMSHDYFSAIEEGATIIRLGTVIFGERDYANPEWKPDHRTVQ